MAISSQPQQEFIIGDDGYVVTDEQTLRMVRDPLQLRILGTLTKEPRTVRQVAEALYVSPAKIQHHFHILEQKELITITSSESSEKSYQSVAPLFQAGSLIPATASTLGETRSLRLSPDQAEALVTRLYEMLDLFSTVESTTFDEDTQSYTISLTMQPTEQSI